MLRIGPGQYLSPHDIPGVRRERLGTMAERHDGVVFACERGGFEATSEGAVLGSFDGRDRRDVRLYATASRREQLLVSIHEHLHHELQWSTVWGTLSAMSGLLAEAGVFPERLGQVSHAANSAAREVHEVFATTVSVGVLGVEEGRLLLTGNDAYTGYLERGLELGGPIAAAPWQFRESAVQMLLRLLMQPAELADVAERGFGALRLRDLEASARPDHRLARVAERASAWWSTAFREILGAFPDRGGDVGDAWRRVAPGEPEQVDALKRWEEEVLIPQLRDVAAAELDRLGLRVLRQDEYLEVIAALRGSFLELAPDDWQVEVHREPRSMTDEPLGAERESGVLWPGPAALEIVSSEAFDARVDEFRHGDDSDPFAVALFLLPATYERQFGGMIDVPRDAPPVLSLAGRVRGDADGARTMPLAFIDPDLSPQQLVQSFAGECLLLTTLRVTRERAFRDAVLTTDRAYVLLDLPLRRQVGHWVQSGWTLRFRVLRLGDDVPVNLVVFRLDELNQVWFLSYRSDAGFGELAQIIDDAPEHIHGDLRIDPVEVEQIGRLTSWLLGGWWRFEEVEAWSTSIRDADEAGPPSG